jgi:hypothetical protein
MIRVSAKTTTPATMSENMLQHTYSMGVTVIFGLNVDSVCLV